MVFVTGRARSGTSMMMHSLTLAGIPYASDRQEMTKENERGRTAYKNPAGFYEGKWNGEDGCLKVFGKKQLDEFPDAKVIYMERSEKARKKSWKDVNKKKFPAPEVEEIMAKGIKFTPKEPVNPPKMDKESLVKIEGLKGREYIVVQYDTFVNEPETYRKDFKKLLGKDFDFDSLMSGIDKSIYIKR